MNDKLMALISSLLPDDDEPVDLVQSTNDINKSWWEARTAKHSFIAQGKTPRMALINLLALICEVLD